MQNKFCKSIQNFYFCRGELAEWSNAAVLTVTGSGVRIPHSPQKKPFRNERLFAYYAVRT